MALTPLTIYSQFIEYFDKHLPVELTIVPTMSYTILYVIVPFIVLIFDNRFRSSLCNEDTNDQQNVNNSNIRQQVQLTLLNIN